MVTTVTKKICFFCKAEITVRREQVQENLKLWNSVWNQLFIKMIQSFNNSRIFNRKAYSYLACASSPRTWVRLFLARKSSYELALPLSCFCSAKRYASRLAMTDFEQRSTGFLLLLHYNRPVQSFFRSSSFVLSISSRVLAMISSALWTLFLIWNLLNIGIRRLKPSELLILLRNCELKESLSLPLIL